MSNITESPAYYEDVRRILDIALQRDGLIYELNTVGQAIHFRQKCYRFRNLLRKMDSERALGLPGHRPSTVYDTISILMVNAEPGKKNSRFLKFEHTITRGKLIDPETGQEIHIDLDPEVDAEDIV